jgi:hypothetical protein
MIGRERDHDLGHGRLQFERRRFRVGDVGDDELREASQQSHCLGEVLRLRLVEVENDGDLAPLAQFLAQPF